MVLPSGPPQWIGRYQVVRLLGQGGMGAVYEVRDPQLGRTLALKLIRAGAASRTATGRFMREAELLAKLSHPGVVRVHELGQSPEGPYLIEELIPGVDLAGRIEESGALEPLVAARLVRDLADALEAVHALGILHRDLKPANVMLRAGTGAPVLLDFGLAREVDSETLTKTGALLGTPAYMAPEQARGSATRELTPAVDVHGLGTILYQALTGELPFDGDSQFEVLAKVLTTDPTWPRALNPAVPAALDAICRRCLAKDPAARYPSAAALRDDLSRFLVGESTEALHDLAAQRRRRVATAAAGVVAALLLLGGLAGVAALALGGRPGARGATASATPAPSEPTTSPAADTPPEREPLWDLAPGDALRVEWLYYETDHSMVRFEMRSALRLAVREALEREGARVLAISSTVERIRATMGSLEAPGAPYDTQRPIAGHPLDCLDAAVGRTFELTLDPATGRLLETRHVRQLYTLMKEKGFSETGVLIPGIVGAYFEKAFDEPFVHALFGALLHLEGPGRPVEWDEGAPDAGTRRWFANYRQREATITPVSFRLTRPDRYRYDLEAQARFAGGRLVVAEATQDLTGRAPPRQKGRIVARADDAEEVLPLRPGDVRSTVRWALTRLD